MHLNDLLGNYKRKRKTKRKENLWYRLENLTGTLAAYLGKTKVGRRAGVELLPRSPNYIALPLRH